MKHLITLTVLFILAAGPASGGGASAFGSPQKRLCGTVTGARWSVKPGSHWAANAPSGTGYTVLALSSQCAAARQWVPVLTRLSPRQLLAGVGAPKGYHCGPASGLSAIHTWFGSCVTGPKGAFKFAFTWVPVGFHLKLSHR